MTKIFEMVIHTFFYLCEFFKQIASESEWTNYKILEREYWILQPKKASRKNFSLVMLFLFN